jgi:RNA polymerase sigma-54 factor
MSLYLEQRQITQLRISSHQILANTLLHMSATDLEQTAAQEVERNPMLELVEHEQCPLCGDPLHGKHCASCQGRKPSATSEWEPEGWNYQDYRTRNWDDEDDNDPVSRVPGGPSLGEYLMHQIGSSLPPEDHRIAEYLVGSLDSHGFLTTTASEAARYLAVSDQRVADVIREIQKMDPPGIGARDTQEALLIQLARLREEGTPHPLAEAILSRWSLFLKQQYHTLSRILGVTEEEVHEEYAFIEVNLNPRPAHAHWSMGEAKPAPDTVYVRPDIAIRRRPAPDEGFEVEVLPGRSFTLRISTEYTRLMNELETRTDPSGEEAHQQLRDYMARGRLFIRCVNQRWQTLQIIGDWLVDYQKGFLTSGERAIRPITRAELAEQIGVHESTVSRAIANKYALLPNGRVIPLSKMSCFISLGMRSAPQATRNWRSGWQRKATQSRGER